MTTIAQTQTPFERFITRLVVQVKQGTTFGREELHRLMVAFASTENVRFTRDEVDGVLTTFSSHDHAGAPATVTFATATGAQPRDDQGPYRGKEMSPEARRQLEDRRQLLDATPLGRQIMVLENLVEHLAVDEHLRGARFPYRGEPLTPAYRRQLLGSSPIGQKILALEDLVAAAPAAAFSAGGTGSKAVTNDYKQQSLTYAQLCRQILKDETASQTKE